MLFPLTMMIGVLAVCAYVVWPRRGDKPGTDDRRAAKADAGPDAGQTAGPESLEGVLTFQLTGGEINRFQYLRAMEQLAARDDERHPLSVPPEVGGAA